MLPLFFSWLSVSSVPCSICSARFKCHAPIFFVRDILSALPVNSALPSFSVQLSTILFAFFCFVDFFLIRILFGASLRILFVIDRTFACHDQKASWTKASNETDSESVHNHRFAIGIRASQLSQCKSLSEVFKQSVLISQESFNANLSRKIEQQWAQQTKFPFVKTYRQREKFSFLSKDIARMSAIRSE